MTSRTVESALTQAVADACQAIAPTWPLDQFIAVNPWWNFIHQPIHTAAATLSSLSGTSLLMPPEFYRQQLRSGAFQPAHIHQALLAAGLPDTDPDTLFSELERGPDAPRVPRMTELADARRDLVHGLSICDFVTHNLSQHCAAYFDSAQATWQPLPQPDLYRSWLHHAATDRTPRLLMGLGMLRSFARTLPDEPMQMIQQALTTLPVPPDHWTDYLTALLMSINGWASWCAWLRWQARLAGSTDDHIVQLLAIRIAWESFAFQHLLSSTIPAEWTTAWHQYPDRLAAARHASHRLWVLQDALERGYLQSLIAGLATTPPPAAPVQPLLQAAFCIDVRSEVFRRALESCSPAIQTLGFAGFFGLPIDYAPLGTKSAQPQLPGLLAPTLHVTQSCGNPSNDAKLSRNRSWRLALRSIWKDFRSSATSTFTFVESCGLFFAADLLRNTLARPASDPATAALGSSENLRPCLNLPQASDPLPEALYDQLAGILRAMSLTQGFARILLLVGHGSASVNNPHAAGLDCGACGGQTGEVNARLLASLLNRPDVRSALHSRGIPLPASTHVLAGLHNTTTDVVTLFDTDQLPPTHTADLAQLQLWLTQAGHLARTERAPALGIPAPIANPGQLLAAVHERSRDWSQVRPEWGLANNAAFLIAPRRRSRALNLAGRVFLHDYEAALDPEARVLEGILTAPMLVTNWINMQYYASTVDNRLYGSGNKVLHNVVGGRIGVFEGNGGDLRIGLPLQSLHDGTHLRHTPLRLSVFVEAPQSAIDAILAKHAVVANLVHNQWLHLFQIQPGSTTISKYEHGTWKPLSALSGPPEPSNLALPTSPATLPATVPH